MQPERLKEIIELHGRWLKGMKDGFRANLSGAYLCGAYLSEADLSETNLSDANIF